MEPEKPAEQLQQQQPAQSPVSLMPSVKISKKLFLAIGIVLVAILFTAASSIYYISQNKQASSDKNISVAISSHITKKSNWKTYTNNYYNFTRIA